MSNIIHNGRIPLSSLRPLIEHCHFPAEALVLMESLPQNIVTKRAERQDLLLFSFFDLKIKFENYTSGRIFQKSGELRWEKEREQVCVVYVGDEDEFSTTVEIFLRDYPLVSKALLKLPIAMSTEQKKYYLFGTRLEEDDLEKIGPAAKEGDFAQARIHRLLRYPLKQGTKGPICFIVQELYDKATGQLVLFRFVGLDENDEKDEEATTE